MASSNPNSMNTSDAKSKDYKPILVKRLSDEGDHLAYNIGRDSNSSSKTKATSYERGKSG